MRKKSDLGSAMKVGIAAGETSALAALMVSKARKLIADVMSAEGIAEPDRKEKADRRSRRADMGATIRPVQPRLIEMVPGRGFGEAYAVPVGRKPVVIGRESSAGEEPDVGLDVPNVVSRRHIEIAMDGGKYTLKPIAMENVTCLNGRIVPNGSTVELEDGDLIGLSSDGYFFIFRCTATPIHMLPVFTDPDDMITD